MKLKEYFDQLAEQGSWSTSLYKGRPTYKTYNFHARRAAVIRLLASEGKYDRILDVGCGTGDYEQIAKDHGSAEYHGLDYSRPMIAAAREEFGDERNKFVVGSGDALPYPDASFDLILALGYIEYFPDPQPALREVRRVLRPGGTVVMQSFKWDFFTKWGDKLRRLRNREKQLPYLPSEWVDNKYSRAELDRMMGEHGFRLDSFIFNNFFVLPERLRLKLPGVYMKTSEWMGRQTQNSLFSCFAVNYIGRYVDARKGS